MTAAADVVPISNHLLRDLIIQVGTSYYVIRRDRTYHDPISHHGLLAKLRDDLAGLIDLWTETANGGRRKLKLDEVIDRYGTVARHVVASPFREGYDAETDTYHERIWRLRPLEPAESAEVAQWLRHFSGADHDLMDDWLATCTEVENPTCALYLTGPRDVGKTLFAAGVARLWSEDSYVESDSLRPRDNSELLRCPVIFADEESSFSTTILRRYIGSDTLTIHRLYLADTRLRGCPRIILADNNGQSLSAHHEAYGRQDTDAVAAKILQIDVPQSAADYLASIGGRPTIAGWIADDVIARHVLWLRDNRTVQRGHRLLVTGHATKNSRLLITRGKVTSLVCTWLVRYGKNPIIDFAKQKYVICGNGKLLVNVDAVCNYWSTYMDKSPVPTVTAIGTALAEIANGRDERIEVEIANRKQYRRYHLVDVDLLVEFAGAYHLDLDVEALRARVSQPC